MFEALLNLEPSSNPFPIQQMRSPLLSTWMCRALETEPPSARNHRRNSLMFLSQAREEEGEPKRKIGRANTFKIFGVQPNLLHTQDRVFGEEHDEDNREHRHRR
ncbi:uncharacterized protein LOC123403297 isoform X2 [Hordeum vulgare subsp. vulgare]|uniref:uncharacterized protein LOC123403297 isoform X2 n=1 Tax=Hordeum vulgare subsp. vulgare TaxID=112509 RepID=UPI001D1A4840|nr:uncharacterized protein LOC123403297 isoform X2 [Hordeum vulgare subsp. vulgare]